MLYNKPNVYHVHHNVFHVYLNGRLTLILGFDFFISAESREFARRSKSLSPIVVKQHIKTRERKDLSHLTPSLNRWIRWIFEKKFLFSTPSFPFRHCLKETFFTFSSSWQRNGAFLVHFSPQLYIIHYILSIKHIFLTYFADDSEIIVIFAADKGLKVSIMMLETSAEGPDQS